MRTKAHCGPATVLSDSEDDTCNTLPMPVPWPRKPEAPRRTGPTSTRPPPETPQMLAVAFLLVMAAVTGSVVVTTRAIC